jgi:biotin carboxylase
MVFQALNALHVENSAGHSEFRVDDDGNVRIIEIGARMGGDCIGSDLVYLSTGQDYIKMVIDVACGRSPEVTRSAGKSAKISFIFDENDLNAFYALQKNFPESIYRVSDFKLSNLGKTTDSATRITAKMIITMR